MSGGSSSSPLTQTISAQGVSGFAQPAVNNLLSATQSNIFNTDASGNITGMQAYQPYSTNPQDYVAGASPMQQQAYYGAANLQTPGQYDMATNAANMGTYGALNAGNQFNAMATNPYAQQAFMSPYIQDALNPQLAEANRNYDISAAQQQAKATQSGAFGGGREAVMDAENERNRNMALNQIYGTGMQNAFQNAQNQMQYGANLGLQGSQAGIQGAGQLSNIGNQQLGAQQNIIGLQNQLGQQQQQNQQQIINAAIQNQQTAQQYPYQQLGLLKNMLTGLPIQSQTQQTYQAAPSILSQLGGLGTTAIAGGKLASVFKEGGAVRMAGGGIASGVPPGKLQSMLGKLSDQQLAQKADLKTNDPETAADAISQQQFRTNARGFAPGGIVAFAKGGGMDTDNNLSGADYEQMPEYMPKSTLLSKTNPTINYGQPQPQPQPQPQQADTPNMMDIAKQGKESGAAYLEALKNAQPDKEQQKWLQLLNFGANLMSGTSPYAAANIGNAAKASVAQMAEDAKANRQAQLEEAKAGYDVSKMDSATLMEIAKNASQNREKELDRLMHKGISKIQAEATIRSAELHLQGVFSTNRATITAAGINAATDKTKILHGAQVLYDEAKASGKPITMEEAITKYSKASYAGQAGTREDQLRQASATQALKALESALSNPLHPLYKKINGKNKDKELSAEDIEKLKDEYIDNYVNKHYKASAGPVVKLN